MTATLPTASRLSAPPPPPIPRLERPLSPAELEEALRAFSGSYYVEHPFHRMMYAGQLSQRQFQGWVTNRLAYQRVVPRKDAAILSNCPDAAVRREWIQRIVDHDGTEPGTGGIELWIRLGVALGARAPTFVGLSGMGDLVLTCTDDQSRNRRLGLMVAAGTPVPAAVAAIGQVVEGVYAASAVRSVAARLKLEMPICEQVYRILVEGVAPQDAVMALMARALKAESDPDLWAG